MPPSNVASLGVGGSAIAKMKEKMKSAGKKALEDAFRILHQSSGGKKKK
jgi:hypothetical protein